MSKKIKKDNIKYALSANDAFIGAVEPGEIFEVECAININDGVITHVGQQLKPDDVHLPFVNGATGPIEVYGAKPGDMLTVEGNAFTSEYYELESGPYISDYDKLLATGLPTTYHVRDTWANFEKLSALLDRRFDEWKRRRN